LGLSDELFALEQRHSIYNNVNGFKPKETRVQISDRKKHRKVLEGKENWENLSSFLQALSILVGWLALRSQKSWCWHPTPKQREAAML